MAESLNSRSHAPAASTMAMKDKSLRNQIDSLCDSFEGEWKAGRKPAISEFLQRVEDTHRSSLFLELLQVEIAFRRQAGEVPSVADYLPQFATYEEEITGALAGAEAETIVGQAETGNSMECATLAPTNASQPQELQTLAPTNQDDNARDFSVTPA